MKKFLPSVQALRNQFETKSTENIHLQKSSAGESNSVLAPAAAAAAAPVRKWKSSVSVLDNVDSELNSRSSSFASLSDVSSSVANVNGNKNKMYPMSVEETAHSNKHPTMIQPIMREFVVQDKDVYKPRHSTAQWDPVIN